MRQEILIKVHMHHLHKDHQVIRQNNSQVLGMLDLIKYFIIQLVETWSCRVIEVHDIVFFHVEFHNQAFPPGSQGI